MLFKQFYTRQLGHASYLVGSPESGTAVIVDPRRDVDQYLVAAREENLKITHVLDTHIHNDYVSGARELSHRTGAQIVTGPASHLGFDHRVLDDGAQIAFGSIVLTSLTTPGHTPEHVSFVVIDEARSRSPWVLLSGGSLLVGSVGRPDLLGAAQEERLIEDLYRSLHERILTLPDYVEVYPTHVSGSLCGSHISARLSTTIGYERRFNQYLELPSLEAFKEAIREGLPTVPSHWKTIREMNLQGPRVLGCPIEPVQITPEDVNALLGSGYVALDTRSPQSFGGAHMPGAYNVWLREDFPVWVERAVPHDRSIVLVLERMEDFAEAARALSWVGYDKVSGYLDGGMWAWQTRGLPIQRVEQISVGELHAMLQAPDHPMVLDVRYDREWRAGHIPGAVHIQGGDLPERTDQLDRDRTVAVHCSTGFRSSVATSILQRDGFRHVLNVLGGFKAWEGEGYEVTRDEAETEWD